MKNTAFNFLKLFLTIILMSFGVNMTANDYLSIDFESGLSTYTDWSFTNIDPTTHTISAHGGSYYGYTKKRKTASIQTKNIIHSPGILTFFISKEVDNTTDSYWKIQISADGTNWKTVKRLSAVSMAKGKWTKVQQSLTNYNDVYVRIYYDGTTSPRCIDDITLTPSNMLTIEPYTTIAVKAPITVTLSTTKGSTIYYTTNGEDPTTASTKYEAPFEITKNGTIIKGIAYTEDGNTVTAEKGYTIQPEEPVFSDTSKTFIWDFNVKLTLPETTDASSTIHYAIGTTATAESPVYTEPIKISSNNEGETVLLHAVVVDKYGNLGKEKICTYTKNTSFLFDFTANPNVWGIIPSKNYTDPNGENVVTGKELEVDGVVMTATNGSSKTCIYSGINGPSLHVYKDGTITFTAPAGYNLSEITFTSNNNSNIRDNTGSYLAADWTGNKHTATFRAYQNVYIYTATIKLTASDTLTFKAKDNDTETYYATFCTDKDVIFPNNITVCGVSVTNEKITLNDLNKDLYEVTDAKTACVNDGYYVPANTGVLVYGMDDKVPYYFPKETQNVNLPANQLKPAPTGGGSFSAEDGYKYYKLAYNDYDAKTDLGFYWGAENGGAFNVKAGLAYLAVPTNETDGAKGFSFDEETTIVNTIEAGKPNGTKTLFNANGQRVNIISQPGIYFINGKKIFLRRQ